MRPCPGKLLSLQHHYRTMLSTIAVRCTCSFPQLLLTCQVAEMRDRELKDTPWEEFGCTCCVLASHIFPPCPLSQDAPVLSASYDDVVSIVDLVKSLSCISCIIWLNGCMQRLSMVLWHLFNAEVMLGSTALRARSAHVVVNVAGPYMLAEGEASKISGSAMASSHGEIERLTGLGRCLHLVQSALCGCQHGGRQAL